MLKHFLFCCVIILLFPFNLFSQGCSDAGFCTMGAMRPSQDYEKEVRFQLRAFELSGYRGQSLISADIYALTADFTFSLGDKTLIQAKLPYMAVTGNFGNTSGLGDISLSATRLLKGNEKYDISGTLGFKIPTNASNIENELGPLPMYYQTSLGTFDLVAGASYLTKNWLMAIGLQLPFYSINANEFTHESLPEYHSQPYVKENGPANQLQRGTDVMLRIERTFRYSKWDFHIGLLPIYRLNKDRITDPDTGEVVPVEDSNGLALSAIGGINYHFNVRNSIKFMFGQKITARDVNPDGLSRENVQVLAYVLRF